MKTEGRVRVGYIDWLALLLVIVGAINWGLVGLAGFFADAANDWNIVNILFDSVPEVEYTIYLLVGLAGLYELYFGYQLFRARRGSVSGITETIE